MILIDYLHQLPSERRAAFAQSCGTSLGHLRNVAYGYRPCAAALAVRVERETAGQVTRRELCPQDWQDIWPELAAQHPGAAHAERVQEAAHG